jgi:hypothetical protein
MSIYNDGTVNFSGFVVFEFHDNIMEYDDYDIVYAIPYMDDVDIDYDILEQFKSSDNYKNLKIEGFYYLYFQGKINYFCSCGIDGTEYDEEVILNYFNLTQSNKI